MQWGTTFFISCLYRDRSERNGKDMKFLQFMEIKRELYQNIKEVLFCLIGHSLLLGICYFIFYFMYLKLGYVFYSALTLANCCFWLFNWIICCVFALFGRKEMIRWTTIGCILSIFAAQIYGLVTVRQSILKFDDSEIVIPLGLIICLTIGFVLEQKKNKKFKKIEYFCLLLVILANLLIEVCLIDMMRIHIGAEKGYLAGYEQAIQDAEIGRHYDVSDRSEKVAQEGFRSGSPEWSGFLQYYSSGYSAGQKDIRNN